MQQPAGVYICDEVRQVMKLHHDLLSDSVRSLPVREQLDLQANRVLDAHRDGNPAVATHLKCWHPQLVGCSTDEVLGFPLTLDEARLSIAREYGFASWDDVESRGEHPPDPEFEQAVDALLAGDLPTLRTLLQQRPSLVHERSAFGHRATLLHYVGSNGVETYRQVVPLNLAEVTQVLINAGADVNATAEIYGGGSTALMLLLTSSHPAEANVTDLVAKVLNEASAY